jgi:hypothetical protein
VTRHLRIAALGFVFAAGGCAPEDHSARDEVARRVKVTVNAGTGELQAVSYDGDGDGRPDAKAFLERGQAMRVEADRDGDGRMDRWEYYRPAVTADAPPTSPRRAPVPAASRLLRIETDTDGDGRVDRWEHFDSGVLTSVSMDLARRGIPDRRLVYDRTGRVLRIESDPDGDSVFTPAAPKNRQPRTGN